MFDVLIRNGAVVDGTGQPRYSADIGIERDRITLVGKAEGAAADIEIDAQGKIVCPGFVDPHSHADLSVFREDQVRLLEPLVRQGITTFVGGNCGMSLAPIGDRHPEAAEDYVQMFTQLDFERDIQWKTMGEFLDVVESRGLLINGAVLAPHGLIRLNEIGPEMRYATDTEVGHMADAVDQALDEGAIGLSTGLQYVPGSQSDTRELVHLGAAVKKHGGIFTSHLRSYSNTVDKAIDEVIEVGRANDIPVEISHIFWVPDYGLLGPLFRSVVRGLAKLSRWWTAPLPIDKPIAHCLEQMMRARAQGVQAGMDVMPTTTGFTHILAFFPPWALAGGPKAVRARLESPEERRRIRHSIEHGKMEWPHAGDEAWTLNLFRLMGWECVRIMAVTSEKNRRYEGMNLVDIARECHVHPFDAACDLLLEEGGHVLVFESMAEPEDAFTERSMYAALKHPEVSVASDAILMGIGKPSHLFYGCYPKFLGRYVREMKLLSLETAIRKITGLPAGHFGLKGRGVLETGAWADVVVFDFDRIASRGTFLDPAKFPAGIEHVFVNGRHVVDGDAFHPEPKPGRLLRRGN